MPSPISRPSSREPARTGIISVRSRFSSDLRQRKGKERRGNAGSPRARMRARAFVRDDCVRMNLAVDDDLSDESARGES